MAVTPFGWLFLPIVVWILLRRRDWLPGLLLVSACLHAPAVFVVGTGSGSHGYGVTPWTVVSFAIFLHLCAIFRQHGLQPLRDTDRNIRRLLYGWLLFAALGIISAFTLPFVFAGLPTYDSMDMLNISVGTKPLEWSIGNAVQAVNLAIIAMLFLYGVFARPLAKSPRSLLAAILIAATVALAASLLQRILIWTGTTEHWLVTESLNPGYRQTIGYLFAGDGVRVGWPFSEPSYASAWFATMFVAGLAAWIWGTPSSRNKFALPLLIISLIGILNSFSGTGAAAVALAGSAIIVYAAFNAWRQREYAMLKRISRLLGTGMASFLLLALLGTCFQLSHPKDGTRSVTQAALAFVEVKIDDYKRTDHSRTTSNRIALDLISRTGGIGVGLGSNRASSYTFNLGSNTGIPSVLLFFILLIVQTRVVWQSGVDTGMASIMLCATLGMFFAINLGIPDLLFPAWWVWPIITFWLTIAAEGISHGASSHPPIQSPRLPG